MRVLIVDDSVVFRSQIKSALEVVPNIEIVGSAANGKIALDKLEQIKVDLIVLDMEMPEMNGIEMLNVMQQRGLNQRVIVFAAPSKTGAALAFDALQAGASDFVGKPQGAKSLEESLEKVRQELVPKIMQFVGFPIEAEKDVRKQQKSVIPKSVSASNFDASQPRWKRMRLESFRPRVILIGSSTGGPTALEKIFSKLKDRRITVPILIAQHMPPVFTESLAKRLGDISGCPAAEGRAGEVLKPGHIYMAPGDYHMTVVRSVANGQPTIRLDQGPKRNSVRPAIDHLFESAVEVYGNLIAAFILTGMGEDGMLGCTAIKNADGGVMIQDKDSSVVWGMPGAVHVAGAYDRMGDLDQCGDVLLNLLG